MTTAEQPAVANTVYTDRYVPMELWGKDHWSTLAYLETVQVDHKMLMMHSDARMRQNRRHFRILGARRPALPMQREHGSRLNDGSYVPGHDDWNCVQDMAHAGLLSINSDDLGPGVVFTLVARGLALAHELRIYKANGGNFQTFKPAELSAQSTPAE